MAFLIETKSRQDTMEAGMLESERDENEADNGVEGENRQPDGEEARKDSRLFIKVKNFNMFIDDAAKGVTDAEFKIWMVIFRFANNGVARVSKKTIAERAGKSERQVARNIAGLIEKGLVVILDRHDGYKRRGNKYWLGIKPLPKASKTRRAKTTVDPDLTAPATNSSGSAGKPDPAIEFFSRKPK